MMINITLMLTVFTVINNAQYILYQDGHEICYVGDEAFQELSQPDQTADALLDEVCNDAYHLNVCYFALHYLSMKLNFWRDHACMVMKIKIYPIVIT